MKDDIVKQRSIKTRKIVRYLLSGHEVLEEAQEWESEKYFPIVPCYGKQTNVDGKVYNSSVIREAKDSQKAYSFVWSSTLPKP